MSSTRIARWADELVRDLRLGSRTLRRAPASSAIAVAMLALGIGANTALFTIVNAAFLRPLPYPEADRLVRITGVFQNNTADEVTLIPDFLAWRAQNRAFEKVAAFDMRARTLTGSGEAMPMETLRASSDLLPLLRIAPARGRNFTPEEDDRERGRVVILTHEFWVRAFGSDPGVLDRTISLDGEPHLIVGVLPANASMPVTAKPDLLTPLGKNLAAEWKRGEGITFTRNAAGRLKEGMSIEQATADLAGIQAGLPRPTGFPEASRFSVKVMPLQKHLMGDIRGASLALLGAVSFVLLIACANVASLLLVKAASRHREIVVRIALGGSRARLVRQLLTESMILAFAAFSVAAFWVRRMLLALVPIGMPGLSDLAVDGRVLLFTAGCSVLAALVFGIAPAFAGTRVAPADALRGSAGSTLRSRGWLHALAAVEVALAVTLLTGATAMLESFWRTRYGSLGFQSSHLATAAFQLPRAKYPDPQRQIAFFESLIQRMRAIPGVEAAAVMERQAMPPGSEPATNVVRIDGRPEPRPGARPVAKHPAVSPGYFHALGIPVLAGRSLLESDIETSQPVVVINRTMANRYFAGEDPIGRRVRVGGADAPWRIITGIVGDVKTAGLTAPLQPVVYLPIRQAGATEGGIVLRTMLDPAMAASGLRRALAEVDSTVAASSVRTMEDLLTSSARLPRFASALLGSFAVLALVLSMTGIYGLMSCVVAWQTREIGIRTALGADRRRVVGGVMGRGMRVLAIGLAVGLVGAVSLMRAIGGVLHGFASVNFGALAVAAVVLSAAVLAACYVPARRAMAVDPMAALRHE